MYRRRYKIQYFTSYAMVLKFSEQFAKIQCYRTLYTEIYVNINIATVCKGNWLVVVEMFV